MLLYGGVAEFSNLIGQKGFDSFSVLAHAVPGREITIAVKALLKKQWQAYGLTTDSLGHI